MNVTVLGGSGFLGSHVADTLSDAGYHVKIFDKNKSPYLRPGQEMIVGDILDPEAVRQAVKGADVVYNFVAIADIEESRELPVETAKVNFLGNINALEAARNEQVKRFVFSSSIYVYSDQGSFYRCSKQASELYIENYHKRYGLEYTILRYGSLYGPRADDNNWIHKTLKQALVDKKIIREGDGEEVREYIHVQDAAKLSMDILNDSYKNRSVIITGNEQIKIKDLMIMIKEILKGDVDLQFTPAVDSDHYEITPYTFQPKIATKLRGQEYVDMGQGILNIINEIHNTYSVSARD